MRDVVSGFGAALLFVRARHILLAAAHGRFILLELLLQFRNFQHGEQLALFYVRAPIHIEFLDVAGNLGVDIHFLVREELGRDFESIRKIAPLHFHHGCVGSVAWVIGRGVVRAAATGKNGCKNKESEERECRGWFAYHECDSWTLRRRLGSENSSERQNEFRSFRLCTICSALAGTRSAISRGTVCTPWRSP